MLRRDRADTRLKAGARAGARLPWKDHAWLGERHAWIAAEAAVVAVLALLRAASNKECRHDEDRPGRN